MFSSTPDEFGLTVGITESITGDEGVVTCLLAGWITSAIVKTVVVILKALIAADGCSSAVFDHAAGRR